MNNPARPTASFAARLPLLKSVSGYLPIAQVLTTILVISFYTGVSTADDQRTPEEEDARYKRFLTEDLKNYPFIAYVELSNVRTDPEERAFPGYTAFLVRCRVFETFKGEPAETVEFIEFWENPAKGPKVGVKRIISLGYAKTHEMFYKPENWGRYPATESFLEFMRSKQRVRSGQNP